MEGLAGFGGRASAAVAEAERVGDPEFADCETAVDG